VLLGAEAGNATRNLHTAFCVENHKEINGLKNKSRLERSFHHG
jgi:hypothetical protein